MILFRLAAAALLATPMLLASAPARADFCMQITGGPFSGDLGFFRFRGDRPNDPGTIKTLRGRVAGLGPVFGTGVVTKDGGTVTLEIGATFFADAEQGQINVAFSPPGAKLGSGRGDYGAYGTGQSLTATRVSCTGEP